GDVFAALQSSAGLLSLTSYSALDIYGSGTIGAIDADGRPIIGSLALHAATIRGFNAGDGVTFNAKAVSLDNSVAGTTLDAVTGVNDVPAGALTFNADTITIGTGSVNVVGYADLNLTARQGMLGSGTGALATLGNIAITAPVIVGSAAADQSINAKGALV